MARNRDLSTDPTNLAAMWKLAKPIYLELKEQTGLSDMALAGMLGNMAQESTFNPKAKKGDFSGYFQNSSNIVKWVIKNFGGYDHEHQIKYIVSGLAGTLPQNNEGLWLQERFNEYVNGINNINSVADAVALWEKSYEKSKKQNLRERINYGNYIYQQIMKEGLGTQQPQAQSITRKGPRQELSKPVEPSDQTGIYNRQYYPGPTPSDINYPVRKRPSQTGLEQYYNGGKLIKKWVN